MSSSSDPLGPINDNPTGNPFSSDNAPPGVFLPDMRPNPYRRR